jgi:NAD(P)-dependent dehydrogenase (short-subunit alcohol dehydrogenase family)
MQLSALEVSSTGPPSGSSRNAVQRTPPIAALVIERGIGGSGPSHFDAVAARNGCRPDEPGGRPANAEAGGPQLGAGPHRQHFVAARHDRAPEHIAYGTSKCGVVYITRQIAADYAKDHVVCNAVAPGKILTGNAGRAVEGRSLAYSRARTPMPRLGSPDDVANAALSLDEAAYVTGENLMVDGGWMAG